MEYRVEDVSIEDVSKYKAGDVIFDKSSVYMFYTDGIYFYLTKDQYDLFKIKFQENYEDDNKNPEKDEEIKTVISEDLFLKTIATALKPELIKEVINRNSQEE